MFPTTEEGPINHALVKAFVQERLSYFLPEYIWEEINLAFGEKWNERLGYGGWFYGDEISDFVYTRIVSVRILMSYEQVEEIVHHMLTYIERNGGFLDDDRC
jgi:hypothetical protein